LKDDETVQSSGEEDELFRDELNGKYILTFIAIDNDNEASFVLAATDDSQKFAKTPVTIYIYFL